MRGVYFPASSENVNYIKWAPPVKKFFKCFLFFFFAHFKNERAFWIISPFISNSVLKWYEPNYGRRD